jgi:hypothetical protein
MRLAHWAVRFCAVAVVLAAVPYSHSIPPFARQYGTSCSTCHNDFPKLNDFGKAFKDAGFKFPKADEDFIKVPPVMLGAPAQKELWPKTIFPGTIPGLPPIGIRYSTFFQVLSRNRNNFAPPSPDAPGIPRTDFQNGTLSLFMAGNFGSDIAFWIDDDIAAGGSGADGGMGDAYLKFVNIGRFLKLPKDALSLRIGQFELDLPFSPARSWNLSGWDIFDQPNVGTSGDFVNNGFAMSSGAQGVEFSGGHSYRGYHYSLAIVNQNTSGTTAAGANVGPGGDAFFSDSNFKDLYSRFSYRFNLERDTASRNEVQAAGATGPHDHTYLDVGGFGFYGRSVQRISDGTNVFTAREPFYRVGANASFNYRNFNLFGVYMYGRDQNQIPTELSDGFTAGPSVHFGGGFLEADYLALPWMMTILRWDNVNSASDRLNGVDGAGFFSPFRSTRQRITPGVQFLIHSNIKAAFEYQIRPQQVVTDPETGETITGPFRTNSAVAGLDFVF